MNFLYTIISQEMHGLLGMSAQINSQERLGDNKSQDFASPLFAAGDQYANKKIPRAIMEIICTTEAPQPVGPYNQGIRATGNLLFLSGQIPLDPATGQLIAGDIGQQTDRVMTNLQAVLAAGGANFSHVVKTTIFLTDLSNFAQVNAVYGRYFSEQSPARSCIQVSALPLGAQVEIECIAVVP